MRHFDVAHRGAHLIEGEAERLHPPDDQDLLDLRLGVEAKAALGSPRGLKRPCIREAWLGTGVATRQTDEGPVWSRGLPIGRESSSSSMSDVSPRKLRFGLAICIPFGNQGERLSALQGRSASKTSSSSNYRLGAVGALRTSRVPRARPGRVAMTSTLSRVLRLWVSSRRAARTSLALGAAPLDAWSSCAGRCDPKK